ncbi:DUF427 domain-containing protein [Aliiroseovarius sp. KMU-50]|uniref:DUF427 domain-containing protein n=1 Tax=Aliiroseovarius salicola TaxID=3009082 RepID=A0ABT4W1T0_9RHOB|nr:DUF427 domain-containing protein [Aliiroseovarius sp. KMU-50]MDA5094431.1 DUF427 domain-containing protein [Aliiroseovarius sp. KMU-50]
MTENIKIRKAEGKWTVRAGGAVLGESLQALEVLEGKNSPVIYFPQGDIAMAFLDESETVTTCPYRGEAKHYSINTKSTVIEDAGWSYGSPVEELDALKGHLAFYGDKVTVART